ncbi:MAG: hypothetical protein IPK61_00940 [Saprospiraceae bacterium]|nr:hypothetical protein [Saprospiraceae bacterium]MBK9378110.1 hypothetical protein [Saprospiraceae bacterium]
MKSCLIYSIVILLSIGASAQKKVLGMPEKFKLPEDRFEIVAEYSDYIRETGRKIEGGTPWMVISDRPNNPLFASPRGKESGVYMDFKEIGYVVEESEDWVKISVAPKVDKATYEITKEGRAVGWIKKTDLLLWSSSIVDKRTGIHRKVFLINEADNITTILKQQDPDIVDIFSGPFSENKEPELKIYSFYFLLKQENNRFLIAQNVNLNNINAKIEIIGWVKKGKCTVWNTRIALEPNFDKEAFIERKNSGRRALCFRTIQSAEQYSNTGVSNPEMVMFDRDPVTFDQSMLARTDSKRFPGSVVRYPMLAKPTANIFRSGVIGDIHIKTNNSNQFEANILSEVTYAGINEKSKLLDAKSKNINILFAIEGTQQVNNLKPGILKAINTVENFFRGSYQLRMGAVIYRDEYEAVANRDVELIKLSSNISEFKEKINSSIFDDVRSQDSDFSCLHFALNKAIDLVGFNPQETNVIIIIGEKADFSTERRRAADVSNIRLVSVNDIMQRLKLINAHICGIQLNQEAYSSNKFRIDLKNILLETSKAQYNDYKGLSQSLEGKINFGTPEPDESDAQMMMIKQSSNCMYSFSPMNSIIGDQEIVKSLNLFTEKVISNISAVETEVTSSTLVKGNKLENSAGEFSAAVAKRINSLLKETKISPSEFSKVLSDKYKLYTNVYVPRIVSGSQNEIFSYVLYMPKGDLKRYCDDLRKCLSAQSDAADKKRESLYAAVLSLVKKLSGSMEMDPNMTANDLFLYMQGIQKEGLSLKNERSFYLKDILNEAKVKDKEIDEFLERIQSKYDILNDIYQQDKRYEFSYSTSSGDLYYWISSEDAF